MKTGMLGIAVLSLSLAFGSISTANAVNDSSNALTAAGQEAFSQLSSCLSSPKAQLNVLYLLDASSSLEEDTDPGRLRGKILGQAIAQMGGISSNRTVNYAVS